MKLIKIFIGFLCIILVACASIPKNEIIYQVKNGRLLDVYDLNNGINSSMGLSYLNNRNGQYGEFSGRTIFYEDNEYLCVVGGIVAAVPKVNKGQKKWSVNGWDCHTNNPLTESASEITCTYKKQTTNFLYSYKKGVISYINESNPEKEFILVDEYGLLAQSYN